MDFSMWLWPYGRWGGFEGMLRAARRIEALGFTSITVSDHTVAPAGREGDSLLPYWPDWAVTAAALASATARLRIVACVAIPYRHPIVTAKQIASVDELSQGRLTLAACVGWWEREFEMLNVPYAQRGAITDEYLDAMRVLWTSDEPEFSGAFTSFGELAFEPRGHQRPHVPIWIAGGAGRKPLERLWRLGDGWMPMGDDRPTVMADAIGRIKETVAARGRDPQSLAFRYTIGLEAAQPALGVLSQAIAGTRGGIVSADPAETVIFSGSRDQVIDSVSLYAAAGFTELAINPSGRSYSECMDRIEWFAHEVMPHLESSSARR